MINAGIQDPNEIRTFQLKGIQNLLIGENSKKEMFRDHREYKTLD